MVDGEAGKGDRSRISNYKIYGKNWDEIYGKKKKTSKKIKSKTSK